MTENSELHILQAMQDSGPGLKGGYTTYGQDIGILMMRTVFPRLPGDIGNARSFRVPVRYRIVDVDPLNLTEKNADSQLIRPFIEAAQELEREGCRAITTSCSFLGASSGVLPTRCMFRYSHPRFCWCRSSITC